MARLFDRLILSIFLTGATFAAYASPMVYVPLGSANEIAIVDAATDVEIGKIGELVNPHGLSATPDGRHLVAGSNQEVMPGQDTIPPKPEGMSEAEHQRHHAAPPAGASQAGMSHVAVVSAQDGNILRRIDVKGAVHHTVVTPDGRYAIATHTTAGGISVIDLSNFKVVKTLPTGLIPNYAVITRDGRRVYVSNAGNNTISEIDTNLWIVTRNIVAGAGPEHLILAPDEKTLYVNNVGNATASAIDLSAGEVVKTYAVGQQPHGVDISDDGKTLFVASKQDNQLVAIDLGDDTKRTITLQPAPYHVTAVRGTGKLYVSSRKEPKIWVLDQHTLKVRGEIPVRGEGHQMVVVNR